MSIPTSQPSAPVAERERKTKNLQRVHAVRTDDELADRNLIAAAGPLVQKPEPGDEVVLRTGGTLMTVLGSDDERLQELLCVWFDQQRRRCQGSFHSDLLKIVE
jgi:hypothetical protein